MSEIKTDILPTLPQVGKKEYLERLPEKDRRNLQKVVGAFEEIMGKMEKKGALLTIGGTITKPMPRKDIDLIIILEMDSHDVSNKQFPTEFDFARADFKVHKELVDAIATSTGLRVEKIVEPAIDEEFDNPHILKHDGSITLRGNTGVPIEFIRERRRGQYGKIRQNTRDWPFVVLSKV